MRAPCPNCETVHSSNLARAIGRFQPEATKYAADHDGAPSRATRAEAEQDACQRIKENNK